MALVLRSQRVAFYGVPSGSGGTVTYKRMKGFTDLTKSMNPVEYTRKYIDETQETTDVTGMSPSLAFTFDRMSPDEVHEDIAGIIDGEKLGTEAVRSIVIVDLFQPALSDDTECVAVKRDFSIIPDSSDGGTDALVYSGTFRANGNMIKGTATSDDNWQTITFSESVSALY